MLAINAVPGPEINQDHLPRNDSDVTGSPFIHPVPPLNEGSWLLGSVITTGWSFTACVAGFARFSSVVSRRSATPFAPFRTDVIPVALKTTAANITTPAPWRSFAISADFALSGAISVRPENE
jgi:hypothetical protein